MSNPVQEARSEGNARSSSSDVAVNIDSAPIRSASHLSLEEHHSKLTTDTLDTLSVKALVKQSFQGVNGQGEVTVNEGDEVILVQRFNDGWSEVRLKTGRSGLAPSMTVALLKSDFYKRTSSKLICCNFRRILSTSETLIYCQQSLHWFAST